MLLWRPPHTVTHWWTAGKSEEKKHRVGLLCLRVKASHKIAPSLCDRHVVEPNSLFVAEVLSHKTCN